MENNKPPKTVKINTPMPMKIIKIKSCFHCHNRGRNPFPYSKDSLFYCMISNKSLGNEIFPDWCELEDDITTRLGMLLPEVDKQKTPCYCTIEKQELTKSGNLKITLDLDCKPSRITIGVSNHFNLLQSKVFVDPVIKDGE